MTKIFEDKIIWITGASSGIGEALVYALVQEGAIVIASSRNVAELERVKSNCTTPDHCHVVPLDLEKIDTFATITTAIIEKHKRIDYLINNGGISQRSKVAETPLDIDRKVMEVNFFGTIALTKTVLPCMLEQGGGYIAATTSIAGKFGFPLRSAYAASKHALCGFFEVLRLEYYQQNINVSLIIPGRVRTNISFNAIDKNGKAHGQMDQGQENGISPQKAARQIIKGLARKKREINVGGIELLMLYFKRFVPALHYKIAKNIKDK